QRADHVRAIGHQRDLARGEALPEEPVVDVVAHGAFAARGAVDVAEIERDLDQLVDVDVVEDALRLGMLRHREISCGRPSSGSGSLFWIVFWMRWRKPGSSAGDQALMRRSASRVAGLP